MKQKFLLKTMLLLCALIVGGVNFAWGQSDKSEIYTSNVSLSTTGGTSASTAKVKLSSSGTEYDALKAGSSKTAGAVKIRVPSGTKHLHLHVAGWTGESVTVSVTPNTNITTTSLSLTADAGISGSGTTFTLYTPEKAPTDYYKTITFTNALTENTDFTFTASSGKRFVIWGVNSEAAATDPNITFSNGSVRVGHALDLSTLWSSNSNGAVTYSITSGDSYATLSGSTLTGTAEGSVTVQGSQAAADSYNAGTATATITVNAALTLSSIAVTTPPTKTTYLEGETFDATGMVVTATYSDASTDDVTASCTFSPTASTELTSSNTAIAISYTENAVEKTTSQAITVKALQSIALSGTYTTTFDQNGTFNHAGVVVTANYDGGDTKDVTSEASFTTPDMSTPGTKTVTVTYREQTTTYDITVNEYVQPTEVTINFSNTFFDTEVHTSGQATSALEYLGNQDNISVSYSVSKGSNYYLNAGQIRCYSGVTLAFSAPTGYNITGISFTSDGNNWSAATPSVGSMSTSDNKIWSGASNNVSFTWSSTTRIVSAAITLEAITPTVSVSESLTDFTYVEGNWPSAAQTISVSGANLTDDISLALDANSKFEMSTTEGSGYTNSLTLTPTTGTVSATTIYVRMKADQAKGNYTGTITLTSNGATTKTVDLTGSVTGQIYAITVDDEVTGGTISADRASAGEGATVTLTATPDAAYTFGAWTVYKTGDQTTTVTVTDNQFTMPDYAVTVSATFNAKPTYAITCVASPVAGGTISASPTSAYEGQTVTLTYDAETGYRFSSIVITKTSDGSATNIKQNASGGDYTFIMPAYAVTATATFEAIPTYTLASSIVPGKHYIIVGEKSGTYKAMGSQSTNNRSAVEVSVSENTVQLVDGVSEFVIYGRDANTRYSIYDETSSGYLYAAASGNNYLKTQATNDINGKWSISIDNNTKEASIVADGSSNRNVMQYNSVSTLFSCYASASQSAVYLYEKVGEATPTAEVTIGESGYASYCSPNALDFTSSDVKAYKAKVNNTTATVRLTQVNVVPAGEGVVLFSSEAKAAAEAKTYSIPVTVEEASDVTGNEMVGVLERTQVSWNPSDGVYNYILQQGQFNKATESGGYLKANRAYLSTDFNVSAGNNPQARMAIVFNDETTGISTMQNAESLMDNVVYDLQGRRVETPRKGSLYIVNGKKVVY